jgi:hypothetical protein
VWRDRNHAKGRRREMRRKLLYITVLALSVSMLGACGKNDASTETTEAPAYLTPDDFEPVYYTSEE